MYILRSNFGSTQPNDYGPPSRRRAFAPFLAAMSSSDGRPIKVEDLTGDRDSSREPDEATASEHGTDGPDSSYFSADEQAAEDGLPLGERFPFPRTIQEGMRALQSGDDAPWGYSTNGIPLQAPSLALDRKPVAPRSANL